MNEPRQRGVAGFTLIEVLAVIFIIMVLSMIMIRMGKRAEDHTKIQRCHTEMRMIALAIDGYFRARGSYPANLGLAQAYGKFPTVDPWGNSYNFSLLRGATLVAGVDYLAGDPMHGTMNAGNTTGYGWTLRSLGPDGCVNTSDDLGINVGQYGGINASESIR